MIVLILTPAIGHGKYYRYGWIGFYIISQYLVRIFQYLFVVNRLVYTMCFFIVDPTVSIINSSFRISFILCLGIKLVHAAIYAKSQTIAAVGLKSVVIDCC
jgi:hypothetical protein